MLRQIRYFTKAVTGGQKKKILLNQNCVCHKCVNLIIYSVFKS